MTGGQRTNTRENRKRKSPPRASHHQSKGTKERRKERKTERKTERKKERHLQKKKKTRGTERKKERLMKVVFSIAVPRKSSSERMCRGLMAWRHEVGKEIVDIIAKPDDEPAMVCLIESFFL